MKLYYTHEEMQHVFKQLLEKQPEHKYDWLTIEELMVVINHYVASKWDDFKVLEKLQELYKNHYPEITEEELDCICDHAQDIIFLLFEAVFSIVDEDDVTADHLSFEFDKDHIQISLDVISALPASR